MNAVSYTHLKKSLHFSKYQTDARNLLGLIYYENGEVADALVPVSYTHLTCRLDRFAKQGEQKAEKLV